MTSYLRACAHCAAHILSEHSLRRDDPSYCNRCGPKQREYEQRPIVKGDMVRPVDKHHGLGSNLLVRDVDGDTVLAWTLGRDLATAQRLQERTVWSVRELVHKGGFA